MKLSRRHLLHLAACAAALLALPHVAAAQAYPVRPVTLVVPFAAGSSPDAVARIVSPRLSELLGQQVVIENVGGAGGMTGAARVAKAAPDGYQLLLGGAGPNAVSQSLFKSPPYDAKADFTPVALLAELPLVLIARKDMPANTLQEFLAYVKANHDRVHYSSAGTVNHLTCAMLTTALGVNPTHVPYRGGGQAVQDVIAGRVDYQCPLAAVALPQIESRHVKAIAILTKDRSPILPNLASAHEQGLANFDSSSWFALFLPKNASSAIVAKLHDAAVVAMNTPAVRDQLRHIGVFVVAPERRSPLYLHNFLDSEISKWAAPTQANGLAEN